MLAAEIPGATKRRGDLDAAAAIRLSEWLRGYRPIQGIPDELFDPTGRPREYWLNFLGDLAEYTPDELKSALDGAAIQRDASFDGHPAALYLGQIKNYAGAPIAVLEVIKDTTEYEAAATSS